MDYFNFLKYKNRKKTTKNKNNSKMLRKLVLSVVATLIAAAVSAAAVTTDPEVTEDNPVVKVCEFAKEHVYHNSLDLDCSDISLMCSKLNPIFECDVFSRSVINIDFSNKNLTALPAEIASIKTLMKL